MADSQVRVEVEPDLEGVARRAAEWITGLAAASRGRFSLCLSGGSTPRRLYQLLAQPPFRERMPWDRVHWFWGDERHVPRDDNNSNYGMARAALLSQAPIPPANIHGIVTAGTPSEGARAYESVLKAYYGGDALDPARPLFDVMLLGLGADGHTASLFPGKPALDERRRWVIEVPEPGMEPYVPRITLTFPAIASSAHAAFLVADAGKRELLARALAGDQSLPSARVRPVGELVWFVDQATRGAA